MPITDPNIPVSIYAQDDEFGPDSRWVADFARMDLAELAVEAFEQLTGGVIEFTILPTSRNGIR